MSNSVRSYTSEELNAFRAPLHVHDAAHLNRVLQSYAVQHPSRSGSTASSLSGCSRYEHASVPKDIPLQYDLRPCQPAAMSPLRSEQVHNLYRSSPMDNLHTTGWTPKPGTHSLQPSSYSSSHPSLYQRVAQNIASAATLVDSGRLGSTHTRPIPQQKNLFYESHYSSPPPNGTWSTTYDMQHALPAGYPGSYYHAAPHVLSGSSSVASRPVVRTPGTLQLQYSVQRTSKATGHWKGSQWITKEDTTVEYMSQGRVRRVKTSRRQTWL